MCYVFIDDFNLSKIYVIHVVHSFSLFYFLDMASVNICPKTETDVLIASRRLGCNNHTNDRDPYMCIPNKEKTSLVEFCYNSVMGIHEKGQ